MANEQVVTTTYSYDHTNQRVRQWVPTVGTSTYANRFFDKLATSTRATSTVYIFAGDMLAATVEGNGTATSTRYVHPDHLGSTNLVTNASGTAMETIEYYPYGSERTNTSTGGVDMRRAFIGQYQDDTANLSYLNARYYAGDRGQFLSEDPTFLAIGNPNQLRQLSLQDQQKFLADPQQLNSYGYARDNPIKYSDPRGEFFESVILGMYFGYGVLMTAIDAYDASTVIGYSDQFSKGERIAAGGKVIFGVATFPIGGQLSTPAKKIGFESLIAYVDATDQFWPDKAYKNVSKDTSRDKDTQMSPPASPKNSTNSGQTPLFKQSSMFATANSTPAVNTASRDAAINNMRQTLRNISNILSTFGASTRII